MIRPDHFAYASVACMIGSTVVYATIESRHEVMKHIVIPPNMSSVF